ncbi:MAG: hypothetical protein Q4E66_08935, partial [Comamonadaceae bacterium]|nr:hypothetical protein [Comamonadaceae bacterium]
MLIVQSTDNTVSPVNNSWRRVLDDTCLHPVSSRRNTMALTSQDIDRIANLARLELSSKESERML